MVPEALLPAVSRVFQPATTSRKHLPTGMSAIQRNAAKPQPNENAGIREKRRFASAQQIVAK
jgi:hypothetical protein